MSANASFVTGYVTGWADKWSADNPISADGHKVQGAPGLCLSRDLTASQLSTAYCRYLSEYQDALSQSSDELLIDAFGKAFPCRQ
ncbi:Rap1a/Tai family immunity protein [Rhizobium leguminosarum]|uniref:Rap1a/Tai family immunity protein n=1 Tax=Rhizobium leguminosarum TaxID=384 RepID=UPI003D7C251F